jgi:hypothetical protein
MPDQARLPHFGHGFVTGGHSRFIVVMVVFTILFAAGGAA